jgi:hypothetical protein
MGWKVGGERKGHDGMTAVPETKQNKTPSVARWRVSETVKTERREYPR